MNALAAMGLAAAMAAAIWAHGWQTGTGQGRAQVQARWDAALAEDQRRIRDAAEAISVQAAALERERAALETRRQEHEDEIRSAGPSVCQPDTDELRALRRRWGGS